MSENKGKITKEFCRGRILLFYPQTEEEAAFIQQKIFGMGFSWGEATGGRKISFLSECVRWGMVLSESGKLYYKPSSDSESKGRIYTSSQLDENYLSPERVFLLEQFNKISARQDAIEKTLHEILKELRPKTLDRPKLPRQP